MTSKALKKQKPAKKLLVDIHETFPEYDGTMDLLLSAEEVLRCADTGDFGMDGDQGFKMLRAAVKKARGRG